MRDYIISRLREASTWRGLIMLATALGVGIKPDVAEAIIALGIALAGGVAIAVPDRVPSRVRQSRGADVPSADHPAADSRAADTGRSGREDLERWEAR